MSRLIKNSTHSNWFDDKASLSTQIISRNGNVIWSDEGDGVVAAQFNGTNTYLTAQSSIFIGTADFNIEAFVKFDSDAGAGGNPQGLIVAGPHNAGIQFGFYWDTNEIFLAKANISHTIKVAAVQDTNWHHAAVSRSGTSTRLFLDGIVVGSATSSTDYSAGNLRIGAYPEAGQYFKGKMTGLSVNKSAIYTTNYIVPSSLPLRTSSSQLLLNFSGGKAPYVPLWYGDTSVISNTRKGIQVFGTPTQSNEGFGVIAAQLNGTTDFFSSPNSTDFNLTGDFTIEAYVMLITRGQQETFIINGRGASFASVSCGWALRQDTTNNLNFYRYDGSTETVLNFGASILGNSSWYHIAASRTGSTLRLFVNGLLTATHTTSVSFNRVTTTDGLFLGRGIYGSPTTYYNNGKITGVRVVNGTGLYIGNFIPGLPSAVSGTVLLLNYGATAAPSVIAWNEDASPLRNTITFVGSTTWAFNHGGASGVNAITSSNTGYINAGTSVFNDIGTGDFTVEMFIRPNSSGLTDYKRLVSLQGTSTSSLQEMVAIEATITSGFVSGGITTDPTPTFNSNVALTYGAWNHIALCRNAGVMTLYINGFRVSQGTSTTSIPNDYRLVIGAWKGFSGVFSRLLDGGVTGIRVVSSALYSGNTLTVPTTLPTAVTGTRLLLNFGASAAPTITTSLPVETLSALPSITNWSGVRIAPDGTKIIAYTAFNTTTHRAYTSRDSGASFTSFEITTGIYGGITHARTSANGNIMHLVTRQTTPRKSTDAGVNWTTLTMGTYNQYLQDMSISDDGVYGMISGEATSGGIFYSTNSLATWQSPTGLGSYSRFNRINATRDGAKVIAMDLDLTNHTGPAYSTNYGASFSVFNITTATRWADAVMSSNASIMLAAARVGGLWVSVNEGSTWTSKLSDEPRNWAGAVVSASGVIMAAVTTSGALYVSGNSGTSWDLHTNLSVAVPLDRGSITMTDNGLIVLIRTGSAIYRVRI
jgi:hypothetical protein